jgi:lipocalin
MFRTLASAGLLANVAAECPPAGFDSVKTFDLDAFVAKRWYVQQQMEGGLEPADLFQCQWADYTVLEKPNAMGFEIQEHVHIDLPDGTTQDQHPCAKIVDASRGKMEVGECFLPQLLAGPFWVYAHNETAGYAAVGGGAPSHEFDGGCRTGTGKIGGGLWIFTREQQRDESIVQEVRSQLKSQGFDLDALLDVNQTGCPTEAAVQV